MPPPRPGLRGPFWRVFPWDAAAPPGAPYTPEFVLPAGVQTGGRFDLGDSPTLYLALEEPAHALAEVLQALRGKRQLRAGHLRRKARGSPGTFHPLALVEAWVDAGVYDALPDLGDPQTLVRFGIRPDDLSSRDRLVTQRISRKLHDEHGLGGFRWWSAFSGDWHVALLFQDRVDSSAIRYGTPDPLHLAHPVVLAAAQELKMAVAKL
jgi:hypothetical protein